MALELVDLITQSGFPGESKTYRVPSVVAKYAWIFGHGGDLDTGRVHLDVEVRNKDAGAVGVWVSTTGVLDAMQGSAGSGIYLAADASIFLAGPIDKLVIYNDETSDAADGIEIIAVKTQRRNSGGYSTGVPVHPGTGELALRLDNVGNGVASASFTAFFPIEIAENAARVYAVAKRTSSGGDYVLDIVADGETITEAYDLEGLTNKALATPNNDAASLAKGKTITVTATSDDADLTADGDLVVIIPWTLG